VSNFAQQGVAAVTPLNAVFGKGISMTTLPLTFNHGYLFVKLEGELWLFDTGAPTTFGASESLRLAGEQFGISSNYNDCLRENGGCSG
jgi:hypothetical protein